MNNKLTVCIINRNYPPDQGATGYHAHLLSQYLLSQEIDVQIVTISKNQIRSSTSNIHYVQPIYNGPRKHLRLLGSHREASLLISKALQLNAHYYIVMTDPPLLNYIAARRMKKRKWILWTMDLYPDAFVANGLVSKKSLLFKWYKQSIIKSPPSLIIALGLKQWQYLQHHYYPKVPSIQWPIGFKSITIVDNTSENKVKSRGWAVNDKITLAYVGNLGEAHNPEVLYWIAHSINPEVYDLVISCQGVHKQRVINDLAHLDHVYLESFIPENLMTKIDVHLVSIRFEWTHICVPSKALTALQYGGVVLFYGSEDSDTWEYISSVGWRVSSKEEVEQWAQSLHPTRILELKKKVPSIYKRLKFQETNGWNELTQFLKESHRPH